MPMSEQYMEQWVNDAIGMNEADIKQLVSYINTVYDVNEKANLKRTAFGKSCC